MRPPARSLRLTPAGEAVVECAAYSRLTRLFTTAPRLPSALDKLLISARLEHSKLTASLAKWEDYKRREAP